MEKVKIEEPQLVQEIRLNKQYASLFYSNYPPETLKGYSTPIIKKKTILSNEYIKKLTSSSIEGNITPPNCRYIEELDSGYIVIIEEPPAYRTIKTSMSMNSEIGRLRKEKKLDLYGYTDWSTENKSPYSFTLAFPYVIFMLYISKYNEVSFAQIFLRTQQMSGLSDYLLKIPMCNISDTGFVCFGNAINKRCQSLTATIQHAIMVWWSATFNTDYTYNYEEYKKVPVLNSYLEWQYMSQTNPMFIYNADWIKMGHTIGQRMKYVKDLYSLKDKQTMGYKQLADMFDKPYDTGLTIKASPRSRKKYKLFFDIAQGTYLDDKTNINNGDSFKTKNGKTAFISSFVGFPDGSDVKYIQIDIDGRLSMMKLTDKCRVFLIKKINEQRRVNKIILENKTVVEPGIILVVKQGSSTLYKKVDYIRKSRGLDGNDIFEIKMGNDYYLSSTIDATEFKIDNPEVNGVILNKDDQYIILNETSNHTSKNSGHLMKFECIDVIHEKIVAKFKNHNEHLKDRSHTIKLSEGNSSSNLYKVSDVKNIGNTFRIGRKMYKLSTDTKNACWGINGIVVYENYYSLKRLTNPDTKELLKSDKFFIEGADFDTEFCIGDKVVVADWQNPLDVLTVKMINGFKYDESTGDICFIMSNKAGSLSESKYVDGKHSIINTGKIRKVTNNVGKLSAGTKIIAKNAGIPCFPKKDVNIIVAFIIDTGIEPLVLCSNGCTLWYNDVIENFKKITLKSKQWPKLDHAPLDLSKIKFQAGDIVNGVKDYKNSYGYLLFSPSTTKALRAMPMENFDRYPESYTFDKFMTRGSVLDCIPAPRIPTVKIEEIGTRKGIFNIHSYDVFECANSIEYLNQRRY